MLKYLTVAENAVFVCYFMLQFLISGWVNGYILLYVLCVFLDNLPEMFRIVS